MPYTQVSSPSITFPPPARWEPRGEENGGDDLLGRVLRTRGLTDPEQAERFLAPALTHLHEPSAIPDLDKAARMILEAARAGRGITIFGDYDVDGMTGSAILWHTLRALAPTCPVRVYVPHRVDEGYGLSVEALEQLAREGASLVVSVDCGITAVAEARRARELGLELIITDHHNPPASLDDLPEAEAVVHPRCPGSTYPFGELCGAGVAYKLAWRLATLSCGSERVSDALRALLIDLLPLAALGTIADIVPLVDENRAIVRFGLSRMRSTPNAGLNELIRASGLSGPRIDADAVGFQLAPRLNACGRMGHAREAIELLTTARGQRARQIAGELCRLNEERKRVEQHIVEQALEMARREGMTGPERRAVVLSREGWHPGVLGIACSRLVDQLHRPVVLCNIADGVCAGSARSVRGVSIHGMLGSCADLLTSFGGHDMAAGLRLRHEDFAPFAGRLIDAVGSVLPPEGLVPTRRYDCNAELAELTPESVASLARLAPFGAGNSPVALRVRGRVVGPPERFGAGGKHLAFRLGVDERVVRTVAWRRGELCHLMHNGQAIEALIRPMISTWGGSSLVEPHALDFRPAE